LPIVTEAAVPFLFEHGAESRPPKEETLPKSLWKSILTDVHFWIPFVVLLIGLFILVTIR